MAIVREVTYGEGGFDPGKPDNNVVAVAEVEVSEPGPQPVAADTVIASVAAMTDEQKADLRAALGL